MLSMCVDCIYVTPFSAVAERALLLFSLRQLTRSAARSCRRPGPCTMLGPTPPQRVGVGPDFQEIDSTKVSAAGDVCPAGSNSASDGRIWTGPAGEASGRDSDSGKTTTTWTRTRRCRRPGPCAQWGPTPPATVGSWWDRREKLRGETATQVRTMRFARDAPGVDPRGRRWPPSLAAKPRAVAVSLTKIGLERGLFMMGLDSNYRGRPLRGPELDPEPGGVARDVTRGWQVVKC